MSLDIMEIALERMTDADEFEKLATDILLNEGYYDIKPMPGGNDFGQDAIADKFFESINKNHRTIFQYSLQANVNDKITKTIIRIQESGIDFIELVYVSKREISGENQEKLKQYIRKTFKISLQFIEKNTIINRLGDLKNGIFHRRFPDIDKQVEVIKSGKPLLNNDQQKNIETSLLKVAISITFNPEAKKARKEVFDNLILSIIYDCKGPENLDMIVKLYQENFNKDFSHPEHIKDSIIRLKNNGQIELQGDKFQITKKALNNLEKINIRANDFTEAILDDIENKILEISKKDFERQTRMRIRKNSLEVLLEVFKLYGLELSNQFLGNQSGNFDIDSKEQIINKAIHGLDKGIGQLLIAVIGNLLANPTEKQGETLGNWAKAFLGIKLMHIDPNLKELELTQFSKKIFVIDTDFLLRCIVKEHPTHREKTKIIKTLVDIGCKVIIPNSVFEEAMNHLSIAGNTMKHFGETLFLLPEESIELEVHNVFVQGFYHFNKNKKISFANYIGHYYNPKAVDTYLIDIIYDRLPRKNVSISDLSEYKIEIPKEIFEPYSKSMLERLRMSTSTRTDDAKKKLSETDAHLFLTCYYMNNRTVNKNAVLGGRAYLITNSNRYLRCCWKNDLEDIVTVKPQTLFALLDIIGKANLTSSELLKLMDNPLLIYSVEQSWPDISVLVKSGVALNDSPLPKLRWDLEACLHDEIAAYKDFKEHVNAEGAKEEQSMETLDSFFNLMQHATKLGYKHLPELDAFINELNDKSESSKVFEKKYEELSSDYEELKSEIGRFGKRRQNYLDRLKNANRRG